MSVTWAPRARMAVNAAWPGVSRKVIGPPAVCHAVGADVLRDAAGLAGDHVGAADAVQQRRLAVVDVTHHRHHRRRGLEVLVLDLVGLEHFLAVLAEELDVAVVLRGQQLDAGRGRGAG